MSVLKAVGWGVLFVLGMSFDAFADDILSQLFKTEVQMAEQGNATAMYIVGTMYEEGTGVEQNDESALAWYRKAAALGNKDAEARLLSVNMKRDGTSNAKTDKPDLVNKDVLREVTRERQASEKARQEAEQIKADAVERVRLLEQQIARDRAEADKAKEASEKSRRLADKTNLLEEQLKRERVETEKARVEAEKARLEAENARLLNERAMRDRSQVGVKTTDTIENTDAPTNATANSNTFKANPCDTPAARFMSTCR